MALKGLIISIVLVQESYGCIWEIAGNHDFASFCIFEYATKKERRQ